MARRATAAELEADVVAEHEARLAAEANARHAVAAMRELSDAHASALAAAIAETRKDERRLVLDQLGADAAAQAKREEAINARAAADRRELQLWKLFARAGVRGIWLGSAVREYSPLVEIPNDGLPVVKGRDVTDVVGFLRDLIVRQDREYTDEESRAEGVALALARGTVRRF